jgi:hypothetical protein
VPKLIGFVGRRPAMMRENCARWKESSLSAQIAPNWNQSSGYPSMRSHQPVRFNHPHPTRQARDPLKESRNYGSTVSRRVVQDLTTKMVVAAHLR